MYDSPIHRIFDDIQYQMVQHGENQIMEAVQKCNIIVDKDELIKALRYDRDQYDKGYRDAIHSLPVIKTAHSICKDELNYRGADIDNYKTFIKKQLCHDIADYLYEHNLVEYDEYDIPDTEHHIISARIKVYSENKENDNAGISD